MRRQWVSSLRARLATGASRYRLLDEAALAEAEELFACTTRPEDIPETCLLVGLLHWHRATAFADGRARSELHTAMPLLYITRLSQPALPLPEPVARILSKYGTPTTEAPAKGGALWDRLIAALEIWMSTGADPHSLRLLVSAARNAVAGAGSAEASRLKRLCFLGGALQRLFEHTGDLALLEQTIAIGRSALEAARPSDDDEVMCLAMLASSLRVAYECTGDQIALGEAVDLGQRALRATPGDHPQRYALSSELSLVLWRTYEHTGDTALLDEAAKAGAFALSAMPIGRAVSAGVLANQGNILRAQFERAGSQPVLTEAIAVTRRAVGAAPIATALWLGCLHNLAGLLYAQFERTGDLPALDEAIDAERRAVEATPQEHPDAPLYRSALVQHLKARFDRTGDVGALDEAISLGQAAVSATRSDHPNRVMYLINLAVALKAKALLTGDVTMLRQAVEVQRTAADAARTVRVRAGALTNLNLFLLTYFEHTGDTAALDEAIEAGHTAVAITAADHPAKSHCEINLALALTKHGLENDDEQSLVEAVELLEAAACRDTARPMVRIDAAQTWGQLAMSIGRPELAARGFAVAVELLPRLAARSLGRADATRWLAAYSQLATDAAACALAVGRADRAIELLEMGRGVLLAQSLEGRTDVNELREKDSALADRFSYLCRCLDTDETDDDSVGNAPDRRRSLADELEMLTASIRAMPGLERFLLPPDAVALTAEAHGGPIAVINLSEYRCDAILLTMEGVQVQELPLLSTESAHERLAAMREALDQTREGGPTRRGAERVVQETLAWLWDSVAEPVLERLGMLKADDAIDEQTVRRIWWVPCGLLAFFPLHAAGRHLDESAVNRHAVLDCAVSSYTPTVRALSYARAQQARAAARRGTRAPSVMAVAMPRTPGASDLPGAQRELEQLTQLLPVAEELIGPGATRDEVLSRLPSSPWAHFACHAQSNPIDPSKSLLLVHDHVQAPLDVSEISKLNLDGAEFAYLSACSTAVSSQDLVDESIHIVTACQLAGYPQVVGTLWEINDVIAAQIAASIYTDLAAYAFDAGKTSVAVHQAVSAIRNRYPYNPSLWAAHIHAGA